MRRQNYAATLGIWSGSLLVAVGCAPQSRLATPTAPATATTPASATSPAHGPAAAIREEEITLATPTGNIYGTLELPAGGFPVPVVLIIAGSGPTNRNGNSALLPGASNYLKMLADGLAARGVASLRYDKRGIAASVAALAREEDIRFDHYIQDAVQWVKKLRDDRRFSSVTIVGHSEGSLIGMVAAREAPGDGFVSIAGAGRKPQELIVEQLRAQLPDSIVRKATNLMTRIEAGETPDSVPPVLRGLFRPSVQPYLVTWFRYTPTDEIARLRVPVLLVQGTTDLQVSQEDVRKLAAAKPDAKLVLIEGMNHVLKAAQGTRVDQTSAYLDPNVPIMPRLIDEVAAFVKGNPRRRALAGPVPPLDDLGGADKGKHFFIAAFIESFGFGALQLAGARRNTALAGALGGTAVIALARETYDRRTKGLFSLGDLVWDSLGAGAALLVLTRTER